MPSSAASEFIFRFRLWHTPDTSVDLSWLDTTHAAKRIARLKSEIKALEQDRARYEQELEAYRETVAATR